MSVVFRPWWGHTGGEGCGGGRRARWMKQHAKERAMPTYMVERILPGGTLESLAALRQAAAEACRTSTATGQPIRYLRSTVTPGESRCRCLFEALDGDLVRAV